MDEIEVHIEQASGNEQPRRAKPSKTDRRVIGALIVAAVVALVVWLGSTTPNQAAPTSTSGVTTTTHPPPTTTSTTEIAAPAANEPAPFGATAADIDEWAADLNPREFALEAPLRLFVRGGSSQIIEVSSTGVSTQAVSCDGASVNYIAGQLGDNLILQNPKSICLAPTDDLETSQIIEGISSDSGFTQVDETSGWFCDWTSNQSTIAKYVLGEPLGELYETINCPLLARSDEVLLDLPPLGLPETDAGGLNLIWDRPGSELPAAPVVASLDCTFSGFALPYLLCGSASGLRAVNLLDGRTIDSIPLMFRSESQQAWGSISPSGRYMMLTRVDFGVDEIPDVGQQFPSVIVDLDDGSVTELSWLRSDFPQISWISDTQLAVIQWDGPDCDTCTPGIELVDLN
ncbi:MAG: hypothetical protein ACC652_09580, partial [Acidimicrobiales bacterium]